MTNTVLLVAAHPDDELLGCAGTMAVHASRGDNVHVLIVSEGFTARDLQRDTAKRDTELEALRQAARKAAEIIGTNPPQFGDLADNRMDGIELLDVIKIIESVINQVKPTIIYTHHGGDLNIDHQITHRAVLTACRPLPGTTVRAIYSFETLSSTEWSPASQVAQFRPTHFVDISDQLEKKLSALSCYTSEMGEFPHPRSDLAVSSLARYRGATAGLAAAEAFEVIRQIDVG
jgi:N-acetylglucosamine malate deacetylase 1